MGSGDMCGRELDPVHVYVRDILTQQWVCYSPAQWADTYRERVRIMVEAHIRSAGGELTISGTPECGRITLARSCGDDVLLDYDWYTLTMQQALGHEPNGIPPLPLAS